jgi:hypothetical protein
VCKLVLEIGQRSSNIGVGPCEVRQLVFLQSSYPIRDLDRANKVDQWSPVDPNNGLVLLERNLKFEQMHG